MYSTRRKYKELARKRLQIDFVVSTLLICTVGRTNDYFDFRSTVATTKTN